MDFVSWQGTLSSSLAITFWGIFVQLFPCRASRLLFLVFFSLLVLSTEPWESLGKACGGGRYNNTIQSTVEPVLSGRPRGMAKWRLNTGWPPNSGSKKYSSKNWISSADQSRRLTSNIETFISCVFMICENKQGNQLLSLVLQYLKLYEHVTDTV